MVDRQDIIKVVDAALKESSASPLQRVNDAVYRYLLNLRKEKTDAQ